MTSGILFWLLALLLAAATLAILLPTLWRAARAPVAPASATLALLREQLAAADLDYAQGRTDAASAERLRAEISRRLLDEQADAPAAWRARRRAGGAREKGGKGRQRKEGGSGAAVGSAPNKGGTFTAPTPGNFFHN